MARLIAVDISEGRKVRIKSSAGNFSEHRVVSLTNHGSSVLLCTTDAEHTLVPMSRSELCALLVEESAELVDEIEDPEAAASNREVNLSFLTPRRFVDYYHRMIMLRHLMAFSAHAPTSKKFSEACREARGLLAFVRENSRISSIKHWSDKTLNDVLRKWRRSGYWRGGFLVQGIEYHPKKSRSEHYAQAEALVPTVRLANPHYTNVLLARTVRLQLGDAQRPMRGANPSAKQAL
jgi:hypothetical protein